MFAQWGLWNEDRPRASLPVCPLSGGSTARRNAGVCSQPFLRFLIARSRRRGTKIGFSGASVIWPVED
jgi:hypothetical protein